MCTINENHNVRFLRYEVQQTESFCYFRPFFALLARSQSKESKFWKHEKKKKKPRKYHHHFTQDTQVYQKSMLICYTVPEVWPVMDVIFKFSFRAMFCPFRTQKIKMYTLYQKLWPNDVWFLTYGAKRMNGWSDGKSYIWRWVLHLKISTSHMDLFFY